LSFWLVFLLAFNIKTGISNLACRYDSVPGKKLIMQVISGKI
jgi:hypothetical protein